MRRGPDDPQCTAAEVKQVKPALALRGWKSEIYAICRAVLWWKNMVTVEKLYKDFGVLADAKDKAKEVKFRFS